MAYLKRFEEVVENEYKGWIHIYTDGSKSKIGVGAAATTGNRTKPASLLKISFIFKAETHAIHLALNKISATKGKNFTIFTDSLRCLQALQKQIRPTQNTKTQAHHSEPTENEKNSEILLDTRTSRNSRKRNRR